MTDTILTASKRLVARHHDPSPVGRWCASPCPRARPSRSRRADEARRPSWPSSSTSASTPTSPRIPMRTVLPGDLRRLLHRALRPTVSWGSDRAWVAHCIYPDEAEIAHGRWGGTGVAPLPELATYDRRWRHRPSGRATGPRGCRWASAATARRRPATASLWMESRDALLLARQRRTHRVPRRPALELGTRGSAALPGAGSASWASWLGAWPTWWRGGSGVPARPASPSPVLSRSDRGVAPLPAPSPPHHHRGRRPGHVVENGGCRCRRAATSTTSLRRHAGRRRTDAGPRLAGI